MLAATMSYCTDDYHSSLVNTVICMCLFWRCCLC